MCYDCVLREVKKLRKEVRTAMSKITDTLATVQADNVKTNAALDNIDADIANLDKQIQDLKDQLAAGGLSPEDQAALDAVAKSSHDLAAKAQVEADKTPDLPNPPPPPVQ